MKLNRAPGATSQILQVFIADSSSTTGAGLTGLAFNSSGLTAYYHRDTDTTATAITLVTMTVGTFTSSGFKEIDATNMPGWYQFCPPNAAFASGAKSVGFHLKGVTNMAPLPIEVDLDAQADVALWNGTAVATPATAGIPDVNVKNMNNVAATSITTINANIGSTQPVNFTGTGGSATVKSDLVNIAGSAVSTSSAQLGVNAVNWAGGAIPSPAVTGVPKIDLTYILGTLLTETAGQIAAGFKQFFNISSPTSTMNTITTVTTTTTATNLTNAPTNGDFTATMKTSLNAATPTVVLSAADSPVVQSGTAQAGAGSTITLSSGASATDSLYVGQTVKITSGTGAGQVRVIITYVGSTKVATVDRAWQTNPDNTSVYAVLATDRPKTNSSLEVVAASVTGNVGGNVVGSVASVTGNVGGNVVGSVASVVGAVGSVTGNVGGNVVGTVASVVGNVGGNVVGTVASVVGNVGGNVVGTVASVVGNVGGNVVGTVASIVSPGNVWDVVLSGHLTAGSTGAALNSAGSAGDPWTTALPGAYGAGTAGFIIGTNLDATVTSRLAPAGTLATVTNLTNAPTVGDFTATMKTSLNAATPVVTLAAAAITAIWDKATSALTTAGSIGKLIVDNLNATITSVKALLPAALVGGRIDASTGAIAAGVDFSATQKTSLNAATPASVVGAVGSVTGNVGGNVVGSVGSVTADVGITQAAANKVFGASGAAMAELVAVPSGTPTPAQALMLLFQSLRNKLTVTATTKTLYNDSGVALGTKTLSDDGTTYTEDELV